MSLALLCLSVFHLFLYNCVRLGGYCTITQLIISTHLIFVNDISYIRHHSYETEKNNCFWLFTDKDSKTVNCTNANLHTVTVQHYIISKIVTKIRSYMHVICKHNISITPVLFTLCNSVTSNSILIANTLRLESAITRLWLVLQQRFTKSLKVCIFSIGIDQCSVHKVPVVSFVKCKI